MYRAVLDRKIETIKASNEKSRMEKLNNCEEKVNQMSLTGA